LHSHATPGAMHPSPTQESCLYFLVEMKLVSVWCREGEGGGAGGKWWFGQIGFAAFVTQKESTMSSIVAMCCIMWVHFFSSSSFSSCSSSAYNDYYYYYHIHDNIKLGRLQLAEPCSIDWKHQHQQHKQYGL
jgi:hypothetical protein